MYFLCLIQNRLHSTVHSLSWEQCTALDLKTGQWHDSATFRNSYNSWIKRTLGKPACGAAKTVHFSSLMAKANDLYFIVVNVLPSDYRLKVRIWVVRTVKGFKRFACRKLQCPITEVSIFPRFLAINDVNFCRFASRWVLQWLLLLPCRNSETSCL